MYIMYINFQKGVASQFYFGAFRGGFDYHSLGVRDRDSMRQYDPDITALLDKMFPCAKEDPNFIIDRCAWKSMC
jgi:hypothetical protein